MPLALRRSGLLVALFGLAFTTAACDTARDRNEVRVVDFRLDGNGYALSDDGLVASFNVEDITSPTQRGHVQTSLATAGDGALVLLYADNSLLLNVVSGQSWTPLPVTRGFETAVGGTPVVDFIVTYTYAFDNEDLYFDVVSTAELDALPASSLATVIPRTISLRLVTIPADRIFRASLTAEGVAPAPPDYETLKRLYNLPD